MNHRLPFLVLAILNSSSSFSLAETLWMLRVQDLLMTQLQRSFE